MRTGDGGGAATAARARSTLGRIAPSATRGTYETKETAMAAAAGRPLKVGLQVPHWEGGVDGVTPRWADLLVLAKQAETVGFDSLWVADRTWTIENEFYEGIGRPVPPEVADTPAGLWEAWTLLTALAVATSRVQLGMLIACTVFATPRSWRRWPTRSTRSATGGSSSAWGPATRCSSTAPWATRRTTWSPASTKPSPSSGGCCATGRWTSREPTTASTASSGDRAGRGRCPADPDRNPGQPAADAAACDPPRRHLERLGRLRPQPRRGRPPHAGAGRRGLSAPRTRSGHAGAVVDHPGRAARSRNPRLQPDDWVVGGGGRLVAGAGGRRDRPRADLPDADDAGDGRGLRRGLGAPRPGEFGSGMKHGGIPRVAKDAGRPWRRSQHG